MRCSISCEKPYSDFIFAFSANDDPFSLGVLVKSKSTKEKKLIEDLLKIFLTSLILELFLEKKSIFFKLF